ncbi:MAG: recombinase family protein, partial [Donghicola eburneus]
MLDTAQSNLIGYARVSTDDQDLSLQVAALKRFGVNPDRILQEHASGKTM